MKSQLWSHFLLAVTGREAPLRAACLRAATEQRPKLAVSGERAVIQTVVFVLIAVCNSTEVPVAATLRLWEIVWQFLRKLNAFRLIT